MAGIMNCFDYFITSVDETLTESGIFNNQMNIPTPQEMPKNTDNTNITLVSNVVDCPDEEYIPSNPPRTTVMHRHHKHIQPTTDCVDEEHAIHG